MGREQSKYQNLSDNFLWTALKDGERYALDEIYNRHIKILYSYGAKITSDHGLVEDSIQEVFITIWEKRKKIKSTTSIKFYLFKSLKRRILRNLKNYHKHGCQYDFSQEGFSRYLVSEPGNSTLDEYTLKKIKKTLDKLTSRQQEVIYLRFYGRIDFPETAAIMGLTVKATYKLFARAIKRLQQHF